MISEKIVVENEMASDVAEMEAESLATQRSFQQKLGNSAVNDSILTEMKHGHHLYEERNGVKIPFEKYAERFIRIYKGVKKFRAPGREVDESGELQIAIADALMDEALPLDTVEQCAGIFARADLPDFAKQMAAFRLIYPLENLSALSFSSYYYQNGKPNISTSGAGPVHSPVLWEALDEGGVRGRGERRKYTGEEIIYRDLVKCAFRSGGKGILTFCDRLEEGGALVEGLASGRVEEAELDAREKELAESLMQQLDSLWMQTEKGQNHLPATYGTTNLTEMARAVTYAYRPTKRYSLADRVARMYCWSEGVHGVAEALELMERNIAEADARHREMYARGQAGVIRQGDLVKNLMSVEYLGNTLENGILAKEFLGAGAKSDATPLDTDFAMVLEQGLSLEEAILKSSAAYFSMGRDGKAPLLGVYLVVRQRGQFERYRYKRQRGPVKYNAEKYELFGPEYEMPRRADGGEFADDFGVRTGVPSAEIDYIVADDDLAAAACEAVKQNLFYIPVVNPRGEVILTPEEYDGVALS